MSCWIFFANENKSKNLLVPSISLLLESHMMSLNIYMKIFRLWSCSGPSILFMNLRTSLTRERDVVGQKKSNIPHSRKRTGNRHKRSNEKSGKWCKKKKKQMKNAKKGSKKKSNTRPHDTWMVWCELTLEPLSKATLSWFLTNMGKKTSEGVLSTPPVGCSTAVKILLQHFF